MLLLNIKKVLACLLLPLCVTASVHYPVSTINEKLLENADAVIRLEKLSFKLKDAGKAILSKHLVVTILNERGAQQYEDFITDYDKHTTVKEMKGYVYDQVGNEVFKLKKVDIVDIGATAYSTAITDSRKKVANFNLKQFSYPFTIEFYDEVETRNTMFYPAAIFVGEEHVSKEEQILEIHTPEQFEIRYKEINMQKTVQIEIEDGLKKYLWSAVNIAADVFEDYRPYSSLAKVITAPVTFSVENYNGTISSWNDIAIFYDKLNANRTILNDETKQKVLALVAQEKDTLKIINTLYQYLQNNTRYMSIQLGIGGWQTASAQEVANNGYGDCKALSNYFKALLELNNIKAYIVLIKAGSEAEFTDIDFPRFAFNHVICCVPFKNDTLWYECTSQQNVPGYLGSFTGNRKALLVQNSSGKLINTPIYEAKDNSIERIANIIIEENNRAQATITSNYTGIAAEELEYVYYQMNQENQRKYLQASVNFSMVKLNSFNIKNIHSRHFKMISELNLETKNILTQMGKTFLLKPYLWYTKSENLVLLKTRISPFYLNPIEFGKQEIDSVVFVLPSSITLTNVPLPALLETKFGTYRAEVMLKGKNLIYYRKLVLKDGLFAATDYKQWIEFNKKIDKLDRVEISLTKLE
jgi:hypothetical protein